MANGHGGSRPGAGRKSNAEKYEGPIARFNDLAASGLTQCFDNLATLADGGYECTETEYQPAGVIFRRDVARNADGSLVTDGKGKPILVQVLAFPDLPADQLVAVRKKIRTLGPDVEANEFLVERITGKARLEPEPEGGETLEIRAALVQAREAMARRKALPAPAPVTEAGENVSDH